MKRYGKTAIIALCAVCAIHTGAYAANKGNAMIKEKMPLVADIYQSMVAQSANSDAAMQAYREYGLDDTQIKMLIAATEEAAGDVEVQKVMASLFTLEELQEMHRFYTGPLSVSIANKLETFQQKLAELMQPSKQTPQIMNTLTPTE